MNKKGVSLVELMITVLILIIIFGAGYALFGSTLSYWAISDAQSDMQEKLNLGLEKISLELQESGFDSNGNIKASMQDNTGTGSTDILRFAVPICLCGSSIIDANGNVRTWGAPSTWAQSGCTEQWTTDGSGLVAICHSTNTNMSVATNVVKSHLSHGDYVGTCASCDAVNYNNRWVEYRLNSGGILVRRVLDQTYASISQSTLLDEVTDFQTTIDAGQGIVTLTLSLRRTMSNGRQINVSGTLNVVLRNGG